MTILFGIRSSWRMVSESYTPGKLKFVGGNLLDLEPVATMIASVCSCKSSFLPGKETWIVFSSTMAPLAFSTVTLKVRRVRADWCCALATVIRRISSTSAHVFAPLSAAMRRHLECAPVGAPVRMSAGSKSATDFPRAAASSAAFSPQGPPPRTTRSKLVFVGMVSLGLGSALAAGSCWRVDFPTIQATKSSKRISLFGAPSALGTRSRMDASMFRRFKMKASSSRGIRPPP
mmetsp:Transcript_31544/g.90463  ORF Transcript_31544/g.90463 Transcript_31544/m.90463 type:complete len:232 (-) Transcript_31544:176-871(-)